MATARRPKPTQQPAPGPIVADDKRRAKPFRPMAWMSTKLHLALITMALMTFGLWLMLGRLPAASDPSGLYSIFTMGLLGAAGIYSGANALTTVSTLRSLAEKKDPANGDP